MPRPKGYYLPDGTKVPGTTTITNRFKDSGGLIHWAWQQGVDGINYRDTSASAADAGTLAHAMAEAYIKGEKEAVTVLDYTDEQVELATTGFAGFRRWMRQTKVSIIDQEMSLVCPEYEYGGTPDAVGIIDGELVLLDWKTSSGVYIEMLVQLAAYVNLIENGVLNRAKGDTDPAIPYQDLIGQDESITSPRITEAHLLRFGKHDGSFHHHVWPRPTIDKAWDYFTHIRAAYDGQKWLKKVV